MDLSQAQADRLNRGIDLLLQRLNQNLGAGYSPQDLPYRICRMEDRRIAFGISHRAPVGSRHPNGQKWITHPGPWVEDCQLIAQTARTPEEIATQFHRCTFEGARPMHTKGGQIMDEAAINAIVNERLKVLLDAKIAEITAKMVQPANDVHPTEFVKARETQTARIEEVEAEEKKAWAPQVAVSPSLLETWTERAKVLGLDPPKIAKKGRIDGRWMRNAQDKWRAHQAAQPEQAGATPA